MSNSDVRFIYTKGAPKPIGPYSQAVVVPLSNVEDLILTSGQVAIHPETDEFLDQDVATQTLRVCHNLEAVLKEAGSDFSKVIKATVFLSNMEDFKEMNTVYENYFGKPARSAVGVKELPLGAKVEIEVIAYR